VGRLFPTHTAAAGRSSNVRTLYARDCLHSRDRTVHSDGFIVSHHGAWLTKASRGMNLGSARRIRGRRGAPVLRVDGQLRCTDQPSLNQYPSTDSGNMKPYPKLDMCSYKCLIFSSKQSSISLSIKALHELTPPTSLNTAPITSRHVHVSAY
jgi:hypothetical protein